MNYKLTIEYDGTRYEGWQRQAKTEKTIQGKIEQALSRILGEPIEISGSGRTDAGAHATGQVANFHCNSQMDAGEILSQLRRYLPEDIGIYSCQEVDHRFHARLNAKRKTYRYRIWNSDEPCVFERKYAYVCTEKLNTEAMRLAAAQFIGEHDFSAFCANRNFKKSTLRRIDDFRIERVGQELQFTVTGNGFLYNMVRIMAGTLLEVGLGKRDCNSIARLYGQKREQAGLLVPAQGLCLMEVEY